MKYYPDISHHKPVQDWQKVKAGCPFLISKATQGTKFVDSTLQQFVAACENMGIPYWLYTFLNKGDEIAQAKFLVNTCKNIVGSHFVGYILDAERDNHPQELMEALLWLQKQGTKCMLYIGYKDCAKYSEVISAMGSNCVLWEARYGLNDGSYNPKYPCHDRAALHQYTSKGTCPGLPAEVDLNRLTGLKPEYWFTLPFKKKVENEFYKACDADEVSIVEALESVGGNGSYSSRKKIAEANGIKGYKGSYSQNVKMLSLLKEGKLRRY